MNSAFLVASCPRCERDPVLLVWALLGDELVTRCLHCDTPVDQELARPADPDELADLGYDVGGAPANEHGERGCRDGQCGVRQPGG